MTEIKVAIAKLDGRWVVKPLDEEYDEEMYLDMCNDLEAYYVRKPTQQELDQCTMFMLNPRESERLLARLLASKDQVLG